MRLITVALALSASTPLLAQTRPPVNPVYRADRSSRRIIVDNGGTPFGLSLAADGSSTGSGAVPVAGREVAGVHERPEVIYTHHPDTCLIDTLSPRRSS